MLGAVTNHIAARPASQTAGTTYAGGFISIGSVRLDVRHNLPIVSQKKVAHSLVSLSSAAIVAVYAAGFMKTRAAAEQLDASLNERPRIPAPPTAGEDRTPEPIEPPSRNSARVQPAAPTAIAARPTDTAPVAAPETKPEERAEQPVAVPAPALAPTAAIELKTAAPAIAAQPAVTPAPPAQPAAPAPEPTAAAAPAAPTAKKLWPKEAYNDGVFLGWGSSRHGDVQAKITIKDGRIEAAEISQCWTRYSCSWIEHLPPQVLARQSANVDRVSGATQSADAFYWAVVDALNKAK